MAKAHCSGHKRFVTNCAGCQSAALKETVGFPGGRTLPEGEVQPPDDPDAPITEGAPGPDAGVTIEEIDSGDIPDPWADGKTPAEGDDVGDWKPPEEREPVPVGGMYPPDIDETEEAMAAEGEFDPDGNLQSVSLVPDDDQPDLTQEEAVDIAMASFPMRLIPEGECPVVELEGGPTVMVAYEELVRRAVSGYIKLGVMPEDAAIVVASEIIMTADVGPEEYEEDVDAETVGAAFEAGVEAAPDLTGCLADYNAGFNAGMEALLTTLRDYYAGDEDAPAFTLVQYIAVQMAGMKKQV